ncbi:uncharacterized protein VTP21DRAFT_6353 [Calcarisporiella thermophila]|uniref:uncharacterized protein n=1 Tax=Calcarisporiella thermophila TaxID=911321 RepID=UPI003742338B
MESEARYTNVTKRLDNLQWSGWHTKITLVLSIGWCLDAFEVTIVSGVMSLLKHYFQVSALEATNITTVWLMGALIGAMGFGYVSDRFGRKISFLTTLVWYSAMTLITAFSPNFAFFLAFRFFTAIGVGAEYTAVNATIGELVPARHRGKVNALVLGWWGVGAVLSNAIEIPLVNHLETWLGWRIGFGVGAVGALFVLWFRLALPESPRWLLVQGRFEEAERVVGEIERLAGQPDNKSLVAESVEYKPHPKISWFRMILDCFTKYPFRVAFAMTLNLSQAFGDYGVLNFMSLALFPLSGIPNERQPFMFMIGNLFSIPAAIIAAFGVDLIGRKKILPLSYLLCIVTACCMYPAAQAGGELPILITHTIYIVIYTITWICAYTSFNEVFPSYIRSTGIGLAVAAGRVGGAVAPKILIAIFQGGSGNDKNVIGSLACLSCFFAAGILISIPWYFFGVEGKGTSLEDMVDTGGKVNRKDLQEEAERGDAQPADDKDKKLPPYTIKESEKEATQ